MHRLGCAARPGMLRAGRRDAVELVDRRLIRGMLIAAQQYVGPASGPIVDLADQPLAGLAVTLAGHQGQEQPALGIGGGMVPIVAPEPIQRIVRVAVGFLGGNVAPLLIDLDLTSPRGNSTDAIFLGATCGI